VDEKVKGLLQELGDAINETVTGSHRIESIMQAIRDSGYEVYLMLEANIAVEDKLTSSRGRDDDEDFTPDDRRFLKRLRIEP
jgi:hypothetical protein